MGEKTRLLIAVGRTNRTAGTKPLRVWNRTVLACADRRVTHLPDREAGEPLGLLVHDVHPLDLSAARALAAKRDKPLDRVRVALEHGFHRPVPVVPHPAGDAVLLRAPTRRVAEEDALHPPVDDDAAPGHSTPVRVVPMVEPSSFVDELAGARIGRTFNFYRDGERAELLRRRLAAYLVSRTGAEILLVGEAPGYRGTRVSGVPLTSERQLSGAGPAEATATIVHRVLAELGLTDAVLLWNVVPTHPHRAGEPRSNRPPTQSEIAAAAPFLHELARGRRMVAVGRVAEAALGGPYVRHPSRGGANSFRAGLAAILLPSTAGGRSRSPLLLEMKTWNAKPGEVDRRWYVVDAEGQILGRLATRIADTLRGKDKPQYTPHVDTGDFVIVVNAEKIAVTGKKLDEKRYYRHSGYPGGLRSRTLREQLDRRPTEVIRKAVKGMLPRNRLARTQITKLKIYAGPEHPHAAQAPEPLSLETK